MLTRTLRTPIALAAAIALGWGGGDTGVVAAQARDSAGVRVVTNDGPGAWTAGQVWKLVPDLRIESSDDGTLPDFATISAIAVNSRGDIFVLDPTAQGVHRFDSQGKFVGTIGGPGAGPGEFAKMVSAMVMGSGDSLVVPDLGNQRVNIFGPEGRFARSFPLSLEHGVPGKWAPLPGGRFAVQLNAMIMPGGSAKDRVNVIARLVPGNSAVDTIVRLPLDPVFELSRVSQIRMFNSTATWTTGEGGLVAEGMTGAYRLSVYDADGTLQMIFSKQHQPVPVSKADREAVRTSFAKAMDAATSKIPNEMAKEMLDNIEFGPTHPAILAVLGGPERTWLVGQGFTSASATTPSALPGWDVFDASGRFLGTIKFPAGFHLMTVAGGNFYGIESDSLDVPSVVRLKRTGPR